MRRGKMLLSAIVVMAFTLSILAVVGSTMAMVIDRTLSLVNTFVPAHASDGSTLVIPIEKTLLSATGQRLNPAGFTFLLTAEGNGENLHAVSDAQGYASFCLSFQPQDAGRTFRYTLSEQNDHQSGIRYSDVRYALEVRVWMQDQLLTAEIREIGEEPGNFVATFVNRYTEIAAPPATGDTFPLQGYGLLLCCGLAALCMLRSPKRRSHNHT